MLGRLFCNPRGDPQPTDMGSGMLKLVREHTFRSTSLKLRPTIMPAGLPEKCSFSSPARSTAPRGFIMA